MRKFEVEYWSNDSLTGDKKMVGKATIFVYGDKSVAAAAFLNSPNQESKSATRLVIHEVARIAV